MNTSKEKSAGKTVFSVISLVLVLAAVIYAAPRLQDLIGKFKSSRSEKQTEVAEVPDDKVVRPTPAQCPAELKAWIPQVEQQLPKGAAINYRLVHMRLSSDRSRLLLDLEKSHTDGTDRFDLVLQRDEFGRYVSGHDEIPMKLYPPELPVEKGPVDTAE